MLSNYKCLERSGFFKVFKELLKNDDWDTDLEMISFLKEATRVLYEFLTGKDELGILLSILETHCERFRFCGGAFVDLMRGQEFMEINDIDIFYVPKEGKDMALVEALDVLRVRKFVNLTINERSSGAVHDIKLGAEDHHLVDLVSRKEVTECTWVDSPSCKSGFLWNGSSYEATSVYPELLIRGILVVKQSISDQRKEKLKRKGWSLLQEL